jgi:hypothetical protein
MFALMGNKGGWIHGTKGAVDRAERDRQLEQVIAGFKAAWLSMEASEHLAMKARADVILQRILARDKADRARVSWRTRAWAATSWVRSLNGVVAALWNSRAVRLLVR